MDVRRIFYRRSAHKDEDKDRTSSPPDTFPSGRGKSEALTAWGSSDFLQKK